MFLLAMACAVAWPALGQQKPRARDLGVPVNVLRRWRAEVRRQEAASPSTTTTKGFFALSRTSES